MTTEIITILPTLENLQPGDHLCCIYETEDEHRAVFTPYLHRGLECGEKVLYIVDVHTAETILGYLRNEGLQMEQFLKSGQFAILTRDDAYMRQGFFDPNAMISLLKAETKQAIAQGYTALRVTGEMTWALRGLPGSERLIEYEIKLNEFLPGSQCLALCQYDRRRFEPEVLMDVMRTHPISVIGAQVYENFYYIPPAELLRRDELPAVELRHWIQNLAERKRAEEELRESEEKYRLLFEGESDAILVFDGPSRRIIDVNPAALNLYGYSREEFLNMQLKDVAAEPEESEKTFQIALMGKLLKVSFRYHRKKDGTVFPVEISAGTFLLRGQQIVIGAIRDVTEGKQAEEKIRAKIREIERLNKLFIGRENRMIELKREVNTLLERLGQPKKYEAPK
jgi:PAS domain S-box-containing protein